MNAGALQRIFSHLGLISASAPDPARAKSLFLLTQLCFAGLVLILIYFATRRGRESAFRVREVDRKTPRRPGSPGSSDPLAEARMRRNEPLRLTGIRIGGEPHEILGVDRHASPAEIQRAYRDLMKRYHPDVVGRPGSREWSDAQKIAEAINQARTRMLEALAGHSHNPNRSGR